MCRNQGSGEGRESLQTRNKIRVITVLTRSEIMARVGSRDSAAEVALRSALHRQGMRFWKNRRVEGINVDIVFPTSKTAVFIDGCFWHCCPKHGSIPKTNLDYWIPKLKENRSRDQRQTRKLKSQGWNVIRVWEHDCLPPKGNLLKIIGKLVG